MAKKLLLLLSFISATATLLSQEITRRDADSMVTALKKAKQGIQRIDLLLNLAQFHIFKPGELAIDFDSATVCIKEAAALNKTVKSPVASGYILFTESFLLNEKGEKDKARKALEQAITFLEAGNNKSYLGRAVYELSNHYSWENTQELVQKTALVKRSVQAFQEAGDLGRKAASLKMLGDLLNLNGDNQQAIEALKLCLLTYDSIGHKPLHGVYSLLARTYTAQTDYKNALDYALLALKTAEADGDNTMQMCQINNDIGLLYNRLKEFELSIRYYKAALDVAIKHDESSSIIVLMTGIAAGYNSLNQPKKALEFLESVPKKHVRPKNDDERIVLMVSYLRTHSGTKEPGRGQKYCDMLMKLVNNPDVAKGTKITAHRTLAGYCRRIKNYEAARFYLSKNKDLARGTAPVPVWVSLDLDVWHRLDAEQGRFREAYEHLKEYKLISDSIFNATKAKQLKQLEVQYETEKKDDSIRSKNSDILVLTQKNQIQQANLKQATIIKNVTIVGIIVAFIIAGLLYRQYTIKQKSNNVITLKNQQITIKNEQLQHLLTEKEWLLKEIHHRVKNNLQIVMSLLNSQSAHINNEPALTAIHDSQHRVHAMSLIHQKLYNTENVSSINMSSYIRELVSYLADSFDTKQRIRFELDIEPLEMDVSQAVPLGLILNEAITNSIKYAFPDKKNGMISISLAATGTNQYLLTISDNGIGIPVHVKNKKSGSLGMSLMQGLTEDLDGRFSIENNNGTAIEISFVSKPAAREIRTATAPFELVAQ
jgi:two-component system, sensor histidine kinase PdtaS